MLFFIVTPRGFFCLFVFFFSSGVLLKLKIDIFRINMICLKIQTGERKTKHDRGVELRSNEKHSSLAVRAGLEPAAYGFQNSAP